MSIDDLLSVAFVFAFIQAIAYYATKQVLGNELTKKSVWLISFGCLLSLWPTIYLGVFLQSLYAWAITFVMLVGAVIYYLRKLSNFNISYKQALLIYGGIVLKLIFISVSVVVLLKLIVLAVLAIGSAFR